MSGPRGGGGGARIFFRGGGYGIFITGQWFGFRHAPAPSEMLRPHEKDLLRSSRSIGYKTATTTTPDATVAELVDALVSGTSVCTDV